MPQGHTVPPTLDQLGRPGQAAAGRQTAAELEASAERPAPGAGPGPDAPRMAGTRADDGVWRRTLQWVVAAAVTIALAALTFIGDGWIPVLSGADLVIHEAGHWLTFWAPPLLCSLAGSFLQVALPLAFAAYFWRRKDGFAVILLVAWAAENLNNVAVYVGDAQRMALSLVGDDGSGAGHDWHNILGDLGWLSSTDALANGVRTASVCLFAVALGLAVLGFSRTHSS
jgi:hypothetical protein